MGNSSACKYRCAAICAEPSAFQAALLYLQAELLLRMEYFIDFMVEKRLSI